MSKEAMKLALEALEWCHGGEPCGTAEAIASLRKALAEQPAQQEPVGEVGSQVVRFHMYKEIPPVGTKLYTSPPAQRTWVGLTDDELADFWFKQSLDWMEFARVIEDALRSKNT